MLECFPLYAVPPGKRGGVILETTVRYRTRHVVSANTFFCLQLFRNSSRLLYLGIRKKIMQYFEIGYKNDFIKKGIRKDFMLKSNPNLLIFRLNLSEDKTEFRSMGRIRILSNGVLRIKTWIHGCGKHRRIFSAKPHYGTKKSPNGMYIAKKIHPMNKKSIKRPDLNDRTLFTLNSINKQIVEE